MYGSIGTPADNTVGESQLSYPLTNFSSTGIDDNATSTAVTIDSSQNTTFAGEVTVSKIISSTSANIAAAFTSTTTTAKLTITDANDTAFIDVNATRLGIGHASSTSLQALQIEPTSAEAMRIDSNGSVGIGIDDPSNDAREKFGCKHKDSYIELRHNSSLSISPTSVNAGKHLFWSNR